MCVGDENAFCGKWECELIGKAGEEQKICHGKCSRTSEFGGERECSCTDMWGPIQISVPCRWKTRFYSKLSIVRFQKFPIIVAFISKMAYFKNVLFLKWPISKINLF